MGLHTIRKSSSPANRNTLSIDISLLIRRLQTNRTDIITELHRTGQADECDVEVQDEGVVSRVDVDALDVDQLASALRSR